MTDHERVLLAPQEAVEMLNKHAKPVYDAGYSAGLRSGTDEATARLAKDHAKGCYDLARQMLSSAADALEVGERHAHELAGFAVVLLARTPDRRAIDALSVLRGHGGSRIPQEYTREQLLAGCGVCATRLHELGGYR